MKLYRQKCHINLYFSIFEIYVEHDFARLFRFRNGVEVSIDYCIILLVKKKCIRIEKRSDEIQGRYGYVNFFNVLVHVLKIE